MSTEHDRVRDRQDGDYEVPVLAEPVGGPIPDPDPDDESPTEGSQ